MKKYAVIGTNGAICFSAEGFDNGLRRVGNNTGNMLFQFATWRILQGPKIEAGPGIIEASIVKNYADVLVLPAANQINANFDLSSWAEYIRQADLPCIVIGLGAQAEHLSSIASEIQLNDSVISFAKEISKRTRTIGVRGQFTKDVLASLGVDNTVITGCPSQSIGKHVTGKTILDGIERLKRNAIENPSVAFLGGTLQDYTRKTESTLYSIAKQYKNHAFVYQTEPRLLRFIYERSLTDDARQFLTWMNGIVRPDLSLPGFFHYLAIHGRYYSSAGAWIDAMRRFDAAIGMRIHGAIAAIQAGRPGICVAFDSRTLELAHTMGIPYILSSDVENCSSLNDLLEAIHFDPSEFDGKREENLARINDVLSI